MIAALLIASVLAQDSQAEMKAKYEAKLASPFLKKAPWLTDYDAALAESRKSGKLVFTEFTRSYAP